jgi:hypothetical protein
MHVSPRWGKQRLFEKGGSPFSGSGRPERGVTRRRSLSRSLRFKQLLKEQIMSASEIELTRQRLRARVEAILSPGDLAVYDAYHQRIRAALARRDPHPIDTSAVEQRVLDKVARDSQAAALDRQLLALLRVERLPQ